jgi:hypothetical protein
VTFSSRSKRGERQSLKWDVLRHRYSVCYKAHLKTALHSHSAIFIGLHTLLPTPREHRCLQRLQPDQASLRSGGSMSSLPSAAPAPPPAFELNRSRAETDNTRDPVRWRPPDPTDLEVREAGALRHSLLQGRWSVLSYSTVTMPMETVCRSSALWEELEYRGVVLQQIKVEALFLLNFHCRRVFEHHRRCYPRYPDEPASSRVLETVLQLNHSTMYRCCTGVLGAEQTPRPLVSVAGGGAAAASWPGRLWRAPQHAVLVWSTARSSNVAHKNSSPVRTVRVVASRMGEWTQPGSGARRGFRACPVPAYCGRCVSVLIRFFRVNVIFPPCIRGVRVQRTPDKSQEF